MLTLAELQSEMREAILAAPGRAFLDAIVSDRIPARQRLRIYRNHFRASLAAGLAAVFPATRILLGDGYFDTMAKLFVTTAPPRDPRLGRYGGDFPRFLAAREELEDVPYAAEVARMEWALAWIADAPDATHPGLEQYRQAQARAGGDVTLRLCDSAVLFDCEWPVHEIRRRVLAGGGAEAVAALIAEPVPVRLLLHRDADGDPCELVLEEWSFTALRALGAGRPVASAVEAATAVRSGCPVTDLIEFAFQAGIVNGLSFTPAPRQGDTQAPRWGNTQAPRWGDTQET